MAKFEAKAAPLTRVFELLRLEKSDIFIVVALTFGAGLISLATPIAVQTLVNIVAMGGVVQPLIVVGLMLFVLLLFSGGLNLFETYVVELMQRRLFVRAALQSAETAQAMQISVRDSENTVELMNRFFDVINVQKSSYQLLTKGLAAILQVIVGSVVLVFYSGYFVFVVVVLILIAWVILKVVGRIAIETAIQESYAKYDMAAWLESIGRNLTMFKFGKGQLHAMQNADLLANRYLAYRKKHFSVLLKQNALAAFVYAAAGSLLLGFGGLLVMQGHINLGQFVAAELIIFGVLSSFSTFIGKLEYLYDMCASLDKLGVIQDLPIERLGGNDLGDGQACSVEAKQLIVLGSNHQCMVNLRVESGKSLGILTNPNNAKYSLAQLLVGLRNPISGVVNINEMDIRQLNLKEMREHIAYVENVDTIEESILLNLTLQQPDASLQSVQDVLKKFGLTDAINELPDGLETILLPSGAPLSKKQARVLMLARALLMKPRLIVVDGLLDGLSVDDFERAFRALQPSQSGWSLIVVTSQREIGERFDAIYELDKA